METQILFNVIVGVAGIFGGWILNNISRSIDKLDEDVMLRLIFERLEAKADK
jgi:hypothetical protein